MTTNREAETSRNELPHSPGAQKAGTKVAGGSAPSGGPRESVPGLYPGLWMSPAIPGVAWTVDVSL